MHYPSSSFTLWILSLGENVFHFPHNVSLKTIWVTKSMAYGSSSWAELIQWLILIPIYLRSITWAESIHILSRINPHPEPNQSPSWAESIPILSRINSHPEPDQSPPWTESTQFLILTPISLRFDCYRSAEVVTASYMAVLSSIPGIVDRCLLIIVKKLLKCTSDNPCLKSHHRLWDTSPLNWLDDLSPLSANKWMWG